MKRLALYPFLLALFIILMPLAHNLEHLDPSQAIRPLILMWLALVGGMILLYIIFKDWQYDSYLVFLITLYFFGFGYLNRLVQDLLAVYGRTLDEQILLTIFTGLFGILAIKGIWRRLGGRTWLTPYLNLLIGLWLLFPAFELLTGFMLEPVQAKYEIQETQGSDGEITLACSETPDIYYIILDGYGRADMLQDLYGFDNQPFIEYLERRGFYVASASHTNYTQTIYSIPSSLNINYIEPTEGGITGQMYISGLINNNQIMAMLKSCGYKTIAIESGFFYTDHPDVDLFLERGIHPTEFESLLLVDSPVDVLAEELNLEPSEQSYEAHRERVLYSFDMLAELSDMPGPKIVFTHIISPHPPFVFNQFGQPVEPEWSYFIGDGDDYRGSLEEYIAGYAEQVQFANQKLEQVIESILANSVTLPVIILHGDHGPGSRLIWDSPAESCLWERTSILNAYFLPGRGDHWLYPSISPVNTFRVVLNAYFRTNLPLLPDKTYFTSHRLERQAIDISAERASRVNCYPPPSE
jgi:hypothetical protein